MARVQIVTDSTAIFEDPNTVLELDIAVIPLDLEIAEKHYRDGIDIDAEEVLHRMRQQDVPVRVTAPSVEYLSNLYTELCQKGDQICVIISSQNFTKTFAHAQAARSVILGRCDIAVIDSQSLSAGLGYVVETVARRARQGATLDDIVRMARGMVPRLYSVYYVNSLTSIQRSGLIGKSQSILGSMLDIKPLLTIEDGELITMEKARTHSQAIDKMMEFVTEFTHIERLSILQNSSRPTDQTRMLQDRLTLEFGHSRYPVHIYEPLLASLAGPDMMGIALLEGSGGRELGLH